MKQRDCVNPQNSWGPREFLFSYTEREWWSRIIISKSKMIMQKGRGKVLTNPYFNMLNNDDWKLFRPSTAYTSKQ